LGGRIIINSDNKLRVNEDVRSLKVRLITEDGENIGIVDRSIALQRAKENDLDLVEVAPDADPPVCKIMDYSRYYYERKKKNKENKKKAKTAQLKQVRLSPNIGKHDLKVKFRKIKDFLEEGHKVKVNMMFKGRQREHLEVGKELLMGIIKELEGVAVCQSEPQFEGFYMSMLLVSEKGPNHK